ncbi:MAG: hypothetical protein JO168_26295 [Solirubrobacterales bacterium]|nr:hypothetical protein [Solirubrobacterales bacterium]
MLELDRASWMVEGCRQATSQPERGGVLGAERVVGGRPAPQIAQIRTVRG